MRRSLASAFRWGEAPRLEDRPGTVGDRAGMAGGIDRQPAARAEGTAGGQDRLRLLGERDHLLMAEPESDARGADLGSLLASRRLARHQHEHAPRLVVPEPHLPDLPFRLAWHEGGIPRLSLRRLDALRFHHLVEAKDQCLDLRLLASQGQRAAAAARQKEEPPLAGLADRSDGALINGSELKDRHRVNTKSRDSF